MVQIYVVVKLPYLRSSLLNHQLSKGMGHNYYGEPAWPNDILYIFPVVILGFTSCLFGLSFVEPINLGERANPFSTPLEILPEWYFYPTFNLLRILLHSVPCLCIYAPILQYRQKMVIKQ